MIYTKTKYIYKLGRQRGYWALYRVARPEEPPPPSIKVISLIEYPYIIQELDKKNMKPLTLFCKTQGIPFNGELTPIGRTYMNNLGGVHNVIE